MKNFFPISVLAVSITISSSAETARQADSFVDSVGVNTHISYTNTPYYSQWPAILAGLQGMHVRHIRDGFYPWAAGNRFYTEHQQLKAAGIDCDFVVSAAPTPEQVALVQQNAGDMAFLEAPNEVDDQRNPKWAASLLLTLPALYLSAQTAGVPVLGPSFVYQSSYPAVGDIAPFINYNNLHVYFGGRNPGSAGWGPGDAEGHQYGSFLWWLDNANVDASGLPSVVTETGYISNSTVTPYTLPQNIQAKYAPRTFLEAFNDGIVKTYNYELIDEVSSPGYGLMDGSLNPKLAYTAISNLLGLLEDPGTSFSPGNLTYTLTGAASDVHHLLLQKRNGNYYLVLWIEASGYNEAANVVTPVASQNVQLSIEGEVAQNIYAMSDQGSMTTTAVNNEPTLTIPVTDSVTVVEIGAPPAPAAAMIAPPAVPTIKNGTYGITNTNSKMMIDDSGNSMVSGTQMIQWKSNGGWNQLFNFTYSNGYYRLQNKKSGLYLSAASSGKLIQQTLQTSDDQLWTISPSSSGWILVNKSTGEAASDPSSSKTEGIGLVLAPVSQGANEVWTIQ